jgi:hypothetical protein
MYRAVPLSCHDHVHLKVTSQSHGTVQHTSSMGMAWYVWITIGCPEAARRWPARVRLLPATTRSSTKAVTRSRLAVQIFPSTTRNFTKDTTLLHNGRVTAWLVWINAAREWHGECELAFTEHQINANEGYVQCKTFHTEITLYSMWETYRLCIFYSMFLQSKVPCCMHQHLQCKCKKEW